MLKRLRVERDPERRKQIIKLGRRALMRWFLVGAKNLLKGVIPLNRRDEQFVARHRADLKIISSKRFNDEDRKKHFSKKKRNPLAVRVPRGRTRAVDEDSPVVARGRRRIPPHCREG